ncbi:MAG: S-methyl-5'-thioadenosine phosphorylase [Anaerolineae bacterium]|nr:S-methyl-5'-thioadenosine phosphorylase [Anaerolineae bacterium]
MEQIAIGVIGGSGLYHMPELSDIRRHSVDTPFGRPSGDVVVGTLRGQRVAFLPRHGEGHVFAPSSIPYRANIFALKSLGVRFILAVNACGSLREDFAPGHIVIPHQIIEYTLSRRERSFFEQGIVAHVSVADPFDAYSSQVLAAAVQAGGGTVHSGGTFLIEDGARFATRAESHLFRQWGGDIIGMTTTPEVFLAREAEIAYATMAHITDYDSWHASEAPVTAEKVMATFQRNIALAQQALATAVATLDTTQTVPAHTDLSGAIMTARDHIPAHLLHSYRPLVGRALGL